MEHRRDPARRRGPLDRGTRRADRSTTTATVREWVGIAIDVTARVERDRELRDREIESSIAFAAGRMGSWRWNTETGRGVWSPELEALVGLEPGEYDGTWESFVGPIVPEDHDLLRDEVVGGGRARTATSRCGTGCATPTARCAGSRPAGRRLNAHRLGRASRSTSPSSPRSRSRCARRATGSRRRSPGSTRCSSTRRSDSRSSTTTSGSSG